ncbi:hypothetical protein BLA13014_06062 [Burkholderia aenigmatica]|uniref:DUF1090 domain-containing protein n=1 Tax=Burkholderia aenigmatica TaxID=2015348 RepID=A0A6P2R3C4_9BURK|nr:MULTISPECIES: DUF1090 family protein [Burkholderia]VWC27377.1 hypothetical protein BLA13014_06062 [Burkholderia aenigmatica]
MKRTLIAAALPLMLLVHSSAFAATQDCATRIRARQTQIDYAKRYGNTQQAMNQQIALERVRANCTDTGQLARVERKVDDRQRDVRNAQDARHQAETDLHAADARGDARKAAKAQRKLANKQHDLDKAVRDLHEAQAARDALRR